MKTRINFLDNLRTFLIFLVIVLHAGIVYEPILENIWVVSDPDKINSLGFARMYLDVFVMFTMFFISGYFIPHSVKGKTTLAFLKSKFNRIMVPWIVAVLTMVPAYKAIFLYSRGLPQEEWFSYFHIFERAGGNPGFFADNPTQNWLWFLPVLFLFQFVYLILYKSKLLSLKISLRSGVILIFLTGLLYSMVISGNDLKGWFHSPLLHFQRERFLLYFMVFLLGSLCYRLKVFDSTNKNKRLLIISNVVLIFSLSVFTIIALNFFFNLVEPGRNYFYVSGMMDGLIYYAAMLLSMFSFLYILIHLFRFGFYRSNNIMVELNRSSYAVYIIHMVVIGIISLLLLNTPLPVMIKYLTVVILTFVVSNILVYTYRITVQKFLSKKTVTMALTSVAVVLAIAIYAKQAKSSGEKLQAPGSPSSAIYHVLSIHEAAYYGDLAAIEWHINNGSDLNAKDEYGSTPLIIAAIFDKTEVAKALIEAGADLSIRNSDGSTPLHIAAFFCRTSIVEALLENGADKYLKNSSGSTALETVAVPFIYVKNIYENIGASLKPMGLKLDYEQIKNTRPEIAKLLKQ